MYCYITIILCHRFQNIILFNYIKLYYMSINFNVSHISYRFYCDKLSSIDLSKNLIIESSANNIEFKSNNRNISFNNSTIFNSGLNMNDKDLSNIHTIRGNVLNIDTLFLRDISNSLANIVDDNFIEDGYIRGTTIGYNPVEPNIISARDGYFTYIDVSGGDSSFNNSVYIKNSLGVSGTTTISNDLIVNGTSYVTLYNAINNYITNIRQDLTTAKIITKDLSASNISISNDLVVAKTSFINDLSISGHLIDNILKVPHDFTIDPSPHNDISGTLIINGDLIVYGNRTTIASSIVEISDITLSVATNLTISNDLYRNEAGLDISNVASIKYDGRDWNFNGGQLSVENKKVSLDVSLIALKNSVGASLSILNSSFDLSYRQLKQNNDNSFNVTYTKTQIDASFILKSILDVSLDNFKFYVDNSFVSALTVDASFSALKTYLDASYILKGTISNPNVIDLSLNFLSNKLDISYVSKSVFDASYNNLKSQIDASFASVRLTSLDTPSISVDTINSKHSSGQTFNNTLWNQLGLDISNGPPLTNNNNKIAISNDGRVVAFASAPVLRNASGGAVTISGGYVIHRFNTSGTFSSTFNGPVEVLIVGGGGGGGTPLGGGGGGGGVIYMPAVNVIAGTSYSVVVGSGGAPMTNGQASSVFGAIAAGGGCGVAFNSGPGASGGSGGGAPANQLAAYGGIIPKGGSSSGSSLGSNNGSANLGLIYGSDGGSLTAIRTAPPTRGAGGGGAGGKGLDTDPNITGNTGQTGAGSGGVGVINVILGPSHYWGGGGGGGGNTQQFGGWGGLGGGGGGGGSDGGGTGGGSAVTNGTNGNVLGNTGGAGGLNTGGGGGGACNGNGGSGGSGIVVIRYLQLQTVSGSTLNLSSWQSDISRGRVYVYELSYNQTSYNWNQLGLSSEIIVGLSNDDQFGWDLALSSNGRVVAGSSITSDASGINSGQVRLFELSNNNRWFQKGSPINGPRANSESGYSISLAGNGNSIAIGAWKDNSNGTNAGAVRVYDFSANINAWRQKGQTIAGISGSYEGYSTALSLDGLTLACGSIETLETSGGTITTSGSYRIHSFTTVGTSTFRPSFSGPVEVLIVGGGGGGGPNLGGGGGGGGVIYMPAVTVTSDTSYSIVVGNGGASGTNGQNSSAFGAIAAGGGTSGSYDTGIGTAGGSGGGAAANGGGLNQGGGVSNVSTLGSNSGFIYGNNGGNMLVSRTGNPTRAAGGGGAGGPALDTNSNTTGDTGRTGMGSGGVGYSSSILGPTYLWGGGGGGAAWSDQVGGYGGLGGGGGGSGLSGGGLGGGSALVDGSNGLVGGNTVGGNGGTNTGGGGGGGTWSVGQGGKGGSGIVIIRYLQQCVKTFVWSGINWVNKGTIQGPQYIGTGIKLSANGNTIVASMPVTKNINFIAGTGWTYSAWTNDVSIRLEKHYLNYTVAVNLGGSMAVATTVNGVPFQTSAYRGTNFLIEGSNSNMGVADSTNNYISGASRDLANDFIYGSNVYTVTLYNLIPGGKYQTTFFSLAWDGGGSTARNQTFSTSSGVSILINPNIYGLNNGIVIKNTFIANNTGTQVFTITGINNGYTFHFYALTNVLLDIKISEELRGGTFVYSYQGGTTWSQLGQTLVGISGGNEFGSSVAISNDGTIISVGTNDISSNRGYVNVYKYVDNYWRQISNTLNGKVLSFKAGIHALSGDGTTLFQSNNNYYSVYGINKLLALNSPITSISGNLIVIGATSVNSLDISRNHSYSTNGYSYKVFESSLATAIMKEYYSDVTSLRHLKVQILGNGNITNRNNSYSSLSDSRLKENIVNTSPKLEDLLKVRVVNYNLKGSDNSTYIGVLAQELEELFPNLVTELEPSPKDIQDGNTIKYKTVNYSCFDSLLIKSLQEQNAMLKNIEKRIIALEEKLDDE